MSDLWGSLLVTSRALDAQRFGLDVAGQNIANVNTIGYRRRLLDLEAVPPGYPWSAGSGVRVTDVRAAADRFVEFRLLQERPAEQREAALADLLAVVEVAIGAPGRALDGRLTAFFDAFARLGEDPVSDLARRDVLSEAQRLAAAFRALNGELQTGRRTADARIGDTIRQIDELARRVASLNQSITTGGDGPDRLHHEDARAAVLNDLADLVDIQTIVRSDGGIDVTIGNGRPLVLGRQAVGVQTTVDASGQIRVVDGATDVTSEITGGRLGGLLHVRDVLIPGYQTRLDTIAHAVVTEVNTLHASGFDLAGAAGGAFFTPIGSVAGAAALVAVDPGVAADPGLIAAAGVPAAGDNEIARAIAALRDARVLGGGRATLGDGWAELVGSVARDLGTARTERAGRAEIRSQLETLRDQVSGVSLDEEAAMMLKFQRAYEANARFFRTIDETIETLLQMVGS